MRKIWNTFSTFANCCQWNKNYHLFEIIQLRRSSSSCQKTVLKIFRIPVICSCGGACPLFHQTPYLITERECVSFSHDNEIKIAKVRALDFASKFFQGPSANLSYIERRCTSGLQRIISFPSELNNSWFGGRIASLDQWALNESHVRFLFFSDYSYLLRCAAAYIRFCALLCIPPARRCKNIYFYFHLFPKVSQLKSDV
jgi:hypothetical protein